MRADERAWPIVLDVYREMYRRARPSVSFDKLVKKHATLRADWYMGYFLSVKEQEIIIFRVCKRHGLTKAQRYEIAKEVQKGYAPNSSYDEWRDYKKVKRNG